MEHIDEVHEVRCKSPPKNTHWLHLDRLDHHQRPPRKVMHLVESVMCLHTYIRLIHHHPQDTLHFYHILHLTASFRFRLKRSGGGQHGLRWATAHPKKINFFYLERNYKNTFGLICFFQLAHPTSSLSLLDN